MFLVRHKENERKIEINTNKLTQTCFLCSFSRNYASNNSDAKAQSNVSMAFLTSKIRLICLSFTLFTWRLQHIFVFLPRYALAKPSINTFLLFLTSKMEYINVDVAFYTVMKGHRNARNWYLTCSLREIVAVICALHTKLNQYASVHHH